MSDKIDYGGSITNNLKQEISRGYANKLTLLVPGTPMVYTSGQFGIHSVHIHRISTAVIDFEVHYDATDQLPATSYLMSFHGNYLIEWGKEEYE